MQINLLFKVLLLAAKENQILSFCKAYDHISFLKKAKQGIQGERKTKFSMTHNC